MYNEYNIYQYDYFKEIDALCVVLCTDEPKYTDEDSHYIHVPKQLFIELTNRININSMCFEITNPKDPLTKIFIKKIEPATDDFENYIWLPNWICSKLNIKSIGDKINFVPIANPKEIKRIKIKGSSSLYIKTDIKKLLESKLEQFRCINLGEVFHINITELEDLKIDSIEFTVEELMSKSEEKVRFGIISNEVEIDFEMPEDIKLLENKKKYIKSIINYKINEKINERLEKNLLIEKKKTEKKSGIFNFSKLLDEKKLSSNIFNPNEIVNLDEIFDDIVKKINSSNINFGNDISNPDNIMLTIQDINILKEIIEEGKNIFKKLAEQHKLNNSNCGDCCDYNGDKDNIGNKNKDNKANNDNSNNKVNITKPNYFNTTPYKLSETTTDSIVNTNTDKKLTPEEIRKLRLEKFK
jgi:hypothetical protein